MLLTRDTLPETIPDIAALDDLLCRPSQALIDDLAKVDGDLMILGVAGKMGPTLAGLAKAALPGRRVIGVARFSDAGVQDMAATPAASRRIDCDLLDEAAIQALPKVKNIVFMAGRKFGAEGDLSLTWAMNAHVPALVAQAFAGSRIVAFSTGCVYPFVPVDGRGADESLAPNPPGEYAQSCVGRERMFEYFSRKFSTPGRLFRLNYAIDMRYGVLHDIATKILQGKPIDVSLGHVNFIWQGDASSQALRCLAHCDTPTSPINVSGHEILRVRDLAAKLGARLGREPIMVGTRAADGVADRHLAGRQTVRPADRRYRHTDRLDRGLGRARDAEPGQAHQIRGARWPILTIVIARLDPQKTRPPGCCFRRSALEPERGRLAVLPDQGTRVRRARRRRSSGRQRSAVALRVRQCLDQHGAGDGELAPPRPCDPTGRCLSRRSREARLDDLARRDAGRRHGLWTARIYADAASCGGCVWRMRCATESRPRLPTLSTYRPR